MAHRVAVYHVDATLLARNNQQLVREHAVRQQGGAAGAEIEVVGIETVLVKRGKPVKNRERAVRQL